MLQTLFTPFFLGAIVSMLAITNPPAMLPMFISYTSGMTGEERSREARKVAYYSFGIMLVSLIAGNLILSFYGISYAAIRIAGGLLIIVTGYRQLFGASTPNQPPEGVSEDREGFAFFPVAMPGIAGPGTMAVMIGLSTEIAEIQPLPYAGAAFILTVASILVVSLCVWMVMRPAGFVAAHISASGLEVLNKIAGFILVCIGVQFIASGITTYIQGM